MFKEFSDFIMKGNVLDLAVAVIIAGAFGLIVSSFTNDILLPPIAMMMGDTDFTQMAYVLSPAEVGADGAVVKEAVAISYGKFIQTVMNFLIVAFVIFMIVKAYNKTQAKEEEAAPDPGPTAEDLLADIRDLLKNK